MQTHFQNALTRVIQFVHTHCRSYKTTSFKKKTLLKCQKHVCCDVDLVYFVLEFKKSN